MCNGAGVAQRVERGTEVFTPREAVNPVVGGSNPPPGANVAPYFRL